mmetsp:Transcript_1533/g.3666  ORF Transcript_1533/g.3666 Transcript_1533/m.3666 type:complete len:260 (+) Transcript_1533:82-861(+)
MEAAPPDGGNAPFRRLSRPTPAPSSHARDAARPPPAPRVRLVRRQARDTRKDSPFKGGFVPGAVLNEGGSARPVEDRAPHTVLAVRLGRRHGLQSSPRRWHLEQWGGMPPRTRWGVDLGRLARSGGAPLPRDGRRPRRARCERGIRALHEAERRRVFLRPGQRRHSGPRMDRGEPRESPRRGSTLCRERGVGGRAPADAGDAPAEGPGPRWGEDRRIGCFVVLAIPGGTVRAVRREVEVSQSGLRRVRLVGYAVGCDGR